VRKIFVFSLIRITTATSHHLLFHEESANDNAEVLVDLMYWFTLYRPSIYSRCAEDAFHDILVCYRGLVLLLSSLFSLETPKKSHEYKVSLLKIASTFQFTAFCPFVLCSPH